VGELEGEKIDIVKWDADLKRYIENAMNPVKISKTAFTDEERSEAMIVVPDAQLAIAIGRQGQNIRLVSKLVGVRLDIMPEREFETSEYAEFARKAADKLFASSEDEESEVVTIADIPGIEPDVVRMLERAEITNIEDLINKSAEELADIDGMTIEKAQMLISTLSDNIEVVEEEVVKPEEAETANAEIGDAEVEYYECPNCSARIEETMSKCPNCGVELVFKEDEE
jgi:N utilization substance protein A